MPGNRPRRQPGHGTALLTASGILDWALIVGTAIGGYYMGNVTPNKRPFQLENPDISFPYTHDETVTSQNLVIATVLVPAVVIIIVSLVAPLGSSVPPGTPKALVWRRKLWELYASLLSFALSMASQWFFVNGLKNLCGKPRPDLLSRCIPDLENVALYVVGGIANITSNGQLVSADICTNTDRSILDDGFRSYPSGHSASSSAGLGHLALFLAFKFGVVYPFISPFSHRDASSFSAFPSRIPANATQVDNYELVDYPSSTGPSAPSARQPLNDPSKDFGSASPPRAVFSARRAGAAPPLYLLVVVLIPFCGSVVIAASRWFDFRHHGFDILFGYLIGCFTGVVSFRLYHLPMSQGAGWAWGPRSADKAFWAGIGSYTWASPRQRWTFNANVEENGRMMRQQENYPRTEQDEGRSL